MKDDASARSPRTLARRRCVAGLAKRVKALAGICGRDGKVPARQPATRYPSQPIFSLIHSLPAFRLRVLPGWRANGDSATTFLVCATSQPRQAGHLCPLNYCSLLMNKVWFITGANRGIGAEIAQAALAAGNYVVAASRQPEPTAATDGDNAHLTVLPLDVTNEAAVQHAVAQVIAQHGRLDVVVNNAGYPLLGALETTSDAEVRRQFDTNVFGVLHVLRAVLPHLRQQRAGHIINISSMQGVIGAPASSSYSGSKFAVEGLTESLQQEVAPLGIKVTLVEPGTFRTELLSDKSLHQAEATLPDYDPTVGQTLRYVAQLSGHQPGDPRKLGAVIVQLANEAEPPLRLLAGSDAVQYVTAALRQRLAEAEQWHDLSVSTDFAPAG